MQLLMMKDKYLVVGLNTADVNNELWDSWCQNEKTVGQRQRQWSKGNCTGTEKKRLSFITWDLNALSDMHGMTKEGIPWKHKNLQTCRINDGQGEVGLPL